MCSIWGAGWSVWFVGGGVAECGKCCTKHESEAVPSLRLDTRMAHGSYCTGP